MAERDGVPLSPADWVRVTVTVTDGVTPGTTNVTSVEVMGIGNPLYAVKPAPLPTAYTKLSGVPGEMTC